MMWLHTCLSDLGVQKKKILHSLPARGIDESRMKSGMPVKRFSLMNTSLFYLFANSLELANNYILLRS